MPVNGSEFKHRAYIKEKTSLSVKCSCLTHSHNSSLAESFLHKHTAGWLMSVSEYIYMPAANTSFIQNSELNSDVSGELPRAFQSSAPIDLYLNSVWVVHKRTRQVCCICRMYSLYCPHSSPPRLYWFSTRWVTRCLVATTFRCCTVVPNKTKNIFTFSKWCYDKITQSRDWCSFTRILILLLFLVIVSS